jgi:putative two-component system response regulator
MERTATGAVVTPGMRAPVPPGARVLVVDEDEQVRYLLRYLLSLEGFAVDEAESADDAHERIDSSVPDVVLIDLAMSATARHGVIRALRADARTRFVPVLLITGGASRKEKLEAIEAGVTDFLAKPFDGEEMVARIRTLVQLKRFTESFEEAREVIVALAATIDARDPYTAGHSERVSYYAEMLGRKTGASETDCRLLHYGGLFHDIGKIAVRDAVLLKPGALSEEERAEMRKHPTVGRDLLLNMRTLEPAIPIVHGHHERFDGSGYPQGLAGEQIPLLARIASVADVYDALTTSRPYRGALTRASALELMADEVKKRWLDPELFAVFRGAIEALPEGFLPGGEEA